LISDVFVVCFVYKTELFELVYICYQYVQVM